MTAASQTSETLSHPSVPLSEGPAQPSSVPAHPSVSLLNPTEPVSQGSQGETQPLKSLSPPSAANCHDENGGREIPLETPPVKKSAKGKRTDVSGTPLRHPFH